MKKTTKTKNEVKKERAQKALWQKFRREALEAARAEAQK